MANKLGKRERMARKRKDSQRKHGHMTIMGVCGKCSKPWTWEFGPAKSSKIGIAPKKLLCGQCRSDNKACPGATAVGP
jgi:hypothetical protein